MIPLSLMEWNTKSPIQWDWENLIMFNSTQPENPKKLPDWEIEGDRPIDSGSFYSSGSGGSNSDLGLASLSKSSNSSSAGEVKTPKLPAPEPIPPEPVAISSEFDASLGSGEPLLGLKLGKRTYFEDVCGGNNGKASTLSVIPGSLVSPTKKSKSGNQGSSGTRCQVEGCNLDLSSAKDYHRKHRVCESHSKSPKVIVSGLERRFCQQCSRFHCLSEFDEKKRSCRRRLSDHNARRRKPQPDPVHLNPATSRLSSSFSDERQQMSLVWNRSQLIHNRPNSRLTMDGSSSSSKFTITKDYVLKPAKLGGQLDFPGTEISGSGPPMLHLDSKNLLPFKPKVNPAQGLEETIISNSVDATQDLHRALSLLSTNSNSNSWGSSSTEPKSTLNQTTTTIIPHSHSLLQAMPLSSSSSPSPDYWRSTHHHHHHHHHPQASVTRGGVHNSLGTSQNDSNNYFQEFQLLRSPYDSSDFYSSHLN